MNILQQIKQQLKSKLVITGIAITILPYIGYYFTDQISLSGAVVNSLVGILVIFLRNITTQPVSAK